MTICLVGSAFALLAKLSFPALFVKTNNGTTRSGQIFLNFGLHIEEKEGLQNIDYSSSSGVVLEQEAKVMELINTLYIFFRRKQLIYYKFVQVYWAGLFSMSCSSSAGEILWKWRTSPANYFSIKFNENNSLVYLTTQTGRGKFVLNVCPRQ